MLFEGLKNTKEKSEKNKSSFSFKDLKRITDIVNHQAIRIEKSSKPTVIIIGPTQSGKSTSIDALLGIPLKYDDHHHIIVDNFSEEMKGKVEKENDFVEGKVSKEKYSKEEEEIKEMEELVDYERKSSLKKKAFKELAVIGGNNKSETEYPKRFSNKTLDFDLIDTRGLLESGMKGREVIASSLILDRYMSTTDSITILVLNSYDNFKKQYFYKLKEAVNGLFNSLDMSVIFVSTKYSYGKEKILTDKLGAEKASIHMNELFMNELEKTCNEEEMSVKKKLLNIENGYNLIERMDKLFDNYSRELEIEIKQIKFDIEESLDLKKEDFIKNYDNYLYIKILKREIANKRVFYFNPLN